MKLIRSKHIWKFSSLAVADCLMFGLTDPRNVPSFGLMAGFLLLVLTFYYLVSGILSFIRLYGISIKRRRRLAFVITGTIGGLVALQSIGELNSFDVLIAALLVIIAYTYSSYAKRPTPVLSEPPSSSY
ncbi:MAG TPA: hypothetical protein VNG32_00990 [Candidatus Dormibacteraeota bacterium]|nr:hypothetical protein [Candidatus Dormibacteraeota bacterium]